MLASVLKIEPRLVRVLSRNVYDINDLINAFESSKSILIQLWGRVYFPSTGPPLSGCFTAFIGLVTQRKGRGEKDLRVRLEWRGRVRATDDMVVL